MMIEIYCGVVSIEDSSFTDNNGNVSSGIHSDSAHILLDDSDDDGGAKRKKE